MRLQLRSHALKLQSVPCHVLPHSLSRAFSALTVRPHQVSSIDSGISDGHEKGRRLLNLAAKPRKDAGTQSSYTQLRARSERTRHDEDDEKFQQRVRARRHAKLELRWLVRNDKIHVRLKELIKTDVKKAEAMVKLLSREPNKAVAAWNILIDDALKSKPPKLNLAFKLYNQMKKSHQDPDEITMRTILNGVVNSESVAPNAPEKCLGLYNYWLAGRNASLQKTPPTLKDYNQLLSIAVKGKNWKMMWQLVTDAPETGRSAPDAATYGIVLEGIEGQMLEADTEMREDHIISALRVWRAILEGCRRGKLRMDSQLATKMGKLLVQSSDPKCLDAVFDLVKLTTGIPRYDELKEVDTQSADLTTNQEQVKSDSDSLEAFIVASFRNPGFSTSKLKIQPSVYILNFVLDACTALHRKTAAIYYYSAFQAAGVLPDRVNLNSYLRVLRETRSAKETVDAIESYVRLLNLESEASRIQKPSWGTFRIAMSTCGRQRKETGSAIEYANHLYNIRRQVFPNEVDTQVLENYLVCIDVADSQTEKTAALKLIAEDLAQLANSSNNKSNGPEMDLIKKAISHIDRQENSGLVSREVFEKWKPVLSNYVFANEMARKDQGKAVDEHQLYASA